MPGDIRQHDHGMLSAPGSVTLDIRRYGRCQSVRRVRLRKPKRLPFLLARVSRTDGQQAYVCSGCHRWSRRVGPAGARRACRRLDGSATEEASQLGIRMRTRLADDADEIRVDLGSGGVVEPSRWEGTIMSTMTSVRANGVELGVETFGRDDDPLVLLAG